MGLSKINPTNLNSWSGLEKKFKTEKKSLSFQNFQNFQKIRHFGKKTVQIHTND